jgi:hypothetical protein
VSGPSRHIRSSSLFLSGNLISTVFQAAFASAAGTSYDLKNILGYEVKATLQTGSLSISSDPPAVITTTITGSINTIPSMGFTATITDTFSVVGGQEGPVGTRLVSTPTVSVNADIAGEVILALLSAVLLAPGWLAAVGTLFFGIQAIVAAVEAGQAAPVFQANSAGTLLAALLNQATIAIAGGALITAPITSVAPSVEYYAIAATPQTAFWPGILLIGNLFLGDHVPEPTISLEGASVLELYPFSPPESGPFPYTALTTQLQQPKVTWSLDSQVPVKSPKPPFQFGLCNEQISQGIVFPSPGTAIGDQATHTLTVKAVDGTVQTNPVVFTASMPVTVVVVEPPRSRYAPLRPSNIHPSPDLNARGTTNLRSPCRQT